jgi:hypothetical protein
MVAIRHYKAAGGRLETKTLRSHATSNISSQLLAEFIEAEFISK